MTFKQRLQRWLGVDVVQRDVGRFERDYAAVSGKLKAHSEWINVLDLQSRSFAHEDALARSVQQQRESADAMETYVDASYSLLAARVEFLENRVSDTQKTLDAVYAALLQKAKAHLE